MRGTTWSAEQSLAFQEVFWIRKIGWLLLWRRAFILIARRGQVQTPHKQPCNYATQQTLRKLSPYLRARNAVQFMRSQSFFYSRSTFTRNPHHLEFIQIEIYRLNLSCGVQRAHPVPQILNHIKNKRKNYNFKYVFGSWHSITRYEFNEVSKKKITSIFMKNFPFYPGETDSKYFGNFVKFTLECSVSHPTGLPPWHSKRLHPVSFHFWWFSGKNKTGRNIWLWVSNSRLPVHNAMNLSLSDELCKRQDRFVCPNLIHGNNYTLQSNL
jgi:hypothetical protein